MNDLIRLYRVVRNCEGKHCGNEYIGDLVTCGECKHWHEGEWYNTCDKHIGHGFPSDYFCADGERRNDE